MTTKSQVLLIVGPTAVGKTALSIQLAHQFDGEIISGDSMQVYRHLDVGTAKVTPDEQDGIPHYLINERDVTDGFTVADFVARAEMLIAEITARGHLPIIVGGTGFYLQALLKGMQLGSPADEALRAKWTALADEHGAEWLWAKLNAVDPAAAATIPAGNVRRLVRALEVYASTGHSILAQTDQPDQYDAFIVGLNTDRAVLYDRINQRVDLMMANGLVEEAKWLLDQGGLTLQAGKGIGYKELFPMLNGQMDQAAAVELLKRNSRHYAKRQLTWFRHQLPVTWFDLVSGQNQISDVAAAVSQWRHSIK
ncbi:tRNA (adenosine(37)-N6)-dimethylallyltransferase MiaA [Furfurilactobacillus sp. WILCCON 0119]